MVNSKMKVVATVQARMASTRLPGKVMKEILGRPIIWHIVNRLKYAKLVNHTMIATSSNPADKEIVDFARKSKIDCYAGSEDDIVDRLYQASRQAKADTIVRITADCPLVDPALVDKVVKYYQDGRGKYDFISNTHPPTYPDGLDTEVFSFIALEKIWQEVTDKFKREWIVTNFWENPEIYHLGNIANDKDLSALRWTVDYPDDFEFVREIYERLFKPDKVFLMQDILDLLKKNPELLKINQKHTRNEGFDKALQDANIT